ncbi:MAG: pilin [Desulfofundulus sp.]
MLKRLAAAVSFFTVYLVLVQAALAGTGQDSSNNNPDIGVGIIGTVNNVTLANKMIQIATGIGSVAGGIGVLALVYVGFKMITAKNEHDRAEAKQHFIQVLIGLGVIGLAVTIVGFIAYLLKGQGQ